jgi:hypothetical protein
LPCLPTSKRQDPLRPDRSLNNLGNSFLTLVTACSVTEDSNHGHLVPLTRFRHSTEDECPGL